MRNKKGSTLIWAIVAVMMVALILVTLLSVSMRHLGRSLQGGETRQAYLTARSAVDVMLEYMDGYRIDIPMELDEWGNVVEGGGVDEAANWTQIEGDNPLISRQINHTVPVGGFNFDEASMGKVVAAGVTRISDKVWRVSATAEYRGTQSTVEARLTLTTLSSEPEVVQVPQSIPVKTVFHGVSVDSLHLPGGSVAKSDSQFIVNGGNLYIKQLNSLSGVQLSRQIEMDRSGNSAGTFYTTMELSDPGFFDWIAGIFVGGGQRVIRVGGNDGVYVSNGSDKTRYRASLSGFGDVRVAGAGIRDGLSSVTVQNGLPASSVNSTVFCKVSGNASLNLNNVLAGGQLFVFVEPGATLTVSKSSLNGAYTYIYGAAGSTIVFRNAKNARKVTLQGALIASNVQIEDNDSGVFRATAPQLQVDYRAPQSDAKIAFTDGDTEIEIVQSGMQTYKWDFESYD